MVCCHRLDVISISPLIINSIISLYKFPKDLNRFNNYMGNLLTRCLVFAGVVSTIMWLLINNSEYYKNIHSAPLIYSILVGGCIAIIYFWNKSMYKKYLEESSSN